MKKNCHLKCHFLLFCTTMNHFSIGLRCVMKSGLYMATSNDQLSGWTKKKLQSTFQSKFAPKEGYGQCLVGCCPSDSLQFSESWWKRCIWEVCSANQWDARKTATPAAGADQHKGPNSSPPHRPTAHCTTNRCFRSWTNWVCLISHWLQLLQPSRQLTSTSSSI